MNTNKCVQSVSRWRGGQRNYIYIYTYMNHINCETKGIYNTHPHKKKKHKQMKHLA